MSENLVTSTEVCKYLDFSMTYLNSLEKSKELVPKRKLPTNGKRYYDWNDVLAYEAKMKGDR